MTAEFLHPEIKNRITTAFDLKTTHILIADDGSRDALAAIELLLALPHPKTTITAMAVVAQHDQISIPIFQDGLEKTRQKFKDKGIPVHTQIEVGTAAKKILAYARQNNPTLIVMGANGLFHAFGVPIGGVVQEVVEEGYTPVLVMHHPFRGLNHAVILTDGSSQSQFATQYLGDLPFPKDCQIDVIHVQRPLTYAELVAKSWQDESGPEGGIAPSIRETEGTEILAKAVAVLKTYGLPAQPFLLYGDPFIEINKYVHDHHIDLVICGSKGLSRQKDWELGSISRKLLHYCGCSLLIVKDRRNWLNRN